MKRLKIWFIAFMLFCPWMMTGHAEAASDPKVIVNGQQVRFADQGPVEQNGRILVPMRSVIEALGGKVVWHASTKSVTAELGRHHAEFIIDSPYAQRTEKGASSFVVQLDVPAQVMNGRTMLPLRASGELLGQSVVWDSAGRTAKIGGGATRLSFTEYPVQGDIKDMLRQELDVFFLTNEIRAAYKADKPFGLHVKLSQVARLKSKDMAEQGYFDHQSPNYGSPFDMMKQFGFDFSYAGENIAMGYRSAREVVAGWEKSPGHLANMLGSFEYIGIGYFAGNVPYWTQQFLTE
jgi:hypothetical protein